MYKSSVELIDDCEQVLSAVQTYDEAETFEQTQIYNENQTYDQTLKPNKSKVASYYEKAVINATKADYTLRSYVLLFFTFSFIGWIWEVMLFLVAEQAVVNTGMLHGPWLPIYGVGGIVVLETLKNIRYSPKKTFISIMAVAGILEYFTHFITEKLFGITWWDYSDYLLNINSRICMEGLFAFGVLGCLAIYIVSPKLNNLIQRGGDKCQRCIMTLLIFIFFIDMVYSLISPNIQNVY